MSTAEYIKKLETERDALKKALQGLLDILPDTRKTLLARSEAEFVLQEKK